jgi:hypothetical protein
MAVLEARRVYTDQGELIGEFMVPKSTPNERGAILAAAQAQELAAAREAALDAMVSDPQPVGPDPAVLADDIETLASNITELNDRLRAVEEARILDPDSATRLAQDLARVELAPLAINEVADTAMAAIGEVSKECQGDLAELRALVVSATDELDLLQAKAQTAIAGTISELQAQAAQDRVRALELLAARAAEMKGDKGDQGRPGPGIGIVSKAPVGQDATVEAIGRPAIPGDLLILGSDEQRPAFRWDGTGWERGPSLSGPVKVVPVSSMVSNVTSTSFNPGTINRPASAGAEQLKPSSIGLNSGGGATVWGSDRWALGSPPQDVTSVLAYIEVFGISGSVAGQRGSCMLNATRVGGGGDWTWDQFAELDLACAIDLNPNFAGGVASNPNPGAGTIANPAQAVRLSLSPQIGTGTGDILVTGWAMPVLPTASAIPGGSPEPAW